MRRAPAALAALLVWIPAGVTHAQCGPRALDLPRTRDSLVVSTAWLAANAARPDLVILQVDHDRASYDAGHVPNARFSAAMDFAVGDVELPPLQQLVAAVEKLGISNASRVILYGEPWHLGRVLLALDYLGHRERIALLDGGLLQWRAEGRPIAKTATPTPPRGSFTPHPVNDVVVDAAWMRAHLADPRFVIVDARSAPEFTGPQTDNGGRGHIPGARHLEWNRTFARPADAEAGTASPLAPREQLQRLLAETGARLGREPVFYCSVGLRASHLYFVARYLGFNPRIYDGSMSDWAARSGFPLVTGSDPGGPR